MSKPFNPKRIYICGPMTGLPNFNYPAFHDAAKKLRALGYEVESPAENQAPECGSWHGWMRSAITMMMQCDTLVALPGWEDSKGATIEVRLARAIDMPIFIYDAILNIHENEKGLI